MIQKRRYFITLGTFAIYRFTFKTMLSRIEHKEPI